ncbi:MAG TPA: CPXCG motif-containing cysteine-rich protein [Xanthomonadaceae bacterium]|nr:CPXCG motif-containing cysteine-rich protein [Xanthomonadaceae bacterium]
MLDSVRITCPFCGERFEALVDASGGDAEYVEDCPVCCRPIRLQLSTDGDDVTLDPTRDD